MSRLDFPPISDLEGIEGIKDTLLNPEMMKAALVAAGSATVTTIAYTELVNRWQKVGDRWWKRALVATGIGYLGGAALWNVNKPLASGVIASMGAQVGIEVYHYAKAKISSGTSGYAAVSGDVGGYSSVGDVFIDDSPDLLRGESHRRAFADVSVEDEQQFASVLAAVA